MRRLTGALLVSLAMLITSSGCSALDEDTAGVPQVAAAFYPLEFVVDRVGGDFVDIEALTTPGSEPHDLEPTIKETAEISEADLVVHERRFQPSIDNAVDQNATGVVLDAAEIVGLQPFADDPEHEEGDDHEDGEEHHEDDGHDHEGDLDPHFWLDPLRLADLGDAVADALSEIAPDHEDDYRANAAALRVDLEELDQNLQAGLANCERSLIVVSHNAFGYLGKYGIDVAPIAGLSPDAEPTPADLGKLQQLITEEEITTVFGERLASPRLTETLADDMGVSTAILDPIEGLTDETADEDYLSLMTSNLTALQEANACR